MQKILKPLFQPFGAVTLRQRYAAVIFWVVFILGLLQIFHSAVMPSPVAVFEALGNMMSAYFLDNFLASIGFTMKAMLISIVITMFLVYLATIPFFLPLTQFISKCRYLSLAGLIVLFKFLISDIENFKMVSLVFGIVPFFVTSFLRVVMEIPQQDVDKAFINKLNRWQALYEIVIVGRLDKLLEVMRQNFAIAWMMITTIEGFSMSAGGLGTLIIKENKTLNLPSMFALLIVILVIGIVTDWLLSLIRKQLFRYVEN